MKVGLRHNHAGRTDSGVGFSPALSKSLLPHLLVVSLNPASGLPRPPTSRVARSLLGLHSDWPGGEAGGQAESLVAHLPAFFVGH